MTIRIKSISKDNDIYSFAKEIEVNNHRFQTPFPMKNPTISQESMPSTLNNEMYEFWSTFNIKDVVQAPFDNNVGDKVINRYRNKITQGVRDKPKIFLTSFKNFKGNPFKDFDDKLIEFLIDSSYLYTDIVTFPIIHGVRNVVNNSSTLQDFLDFIKTSYKIADTLNNKPIMGIIPPIPQAFIRKIVELFVSLDLEMFCFDFNGSSLSAYYPHYSQVFRTLYNIDKRILESTIKYTVNLMLPSNRNRNNPFPAEDLLIPTVGTDILGINHLSGGRPAAKTPKKKKSKKPTKTGVKKKTNLLSIDEYNYHRISDRSEFEKIFPKPLIKPNFQKFTAATYKDRNNFQKKFNYANLNIEMNSLHQRIKNNESILKILAGKIGIKDQIRNKVNGLDNFLKTRSLYDF